MRSAYLQHHGILGQKWGVRRYENEDGTLTEAGKKRYSKSESRKEKIEKKNKISKKTIIKGAAATAAALAIIGGISYAKYEFTPITKESIGIIGYGARGRALYGPIQTTMSRYEWQKLMKMSIN